MVTRWVSGWGDENGLTAFGTALPERLFWQRVSDLPLGLRSDVGHELCLLRADGLIVVDRNWVKFLSSSGGKQWTVRLNAMVEGRSTLVATADVVAIFGGKEAVGIHVNDGSIRWRLNYTDVAKRSGWDKHLMRCIGAWSGKAVVNCGYGHAIIDIESGEFQGAQPHLPYRYISIGGIVTIHGADDHFRPLLLSDPQITMDEVRNVGHLNGMAKIGKVLVVLGSNGCHGWDVTSGRRLWSCAIPRTDEGEVSRLMVTNDIVYHCTTVKCQTGACRVKTIKPLTGEIETESMAEGFIGFYGCGTANELVFPSEMNDKFMLHAMDRTTGAWRVMDGPECNMDGIEIPYRVLSDGDQGIWYFCTQGIFYGSYKSVPFGVTDTKKKSPARKRTRK